MDGVISTKIYELLRDAVKGNVEDYSISVLDPNKKGEGYLGEMCYVSLEDKNSGETIDFIVKQAFSKDDVRKAYPIRRIYLNEILFYTKIWPHLKTLQDGKLIEPFDKIPKCFVTSSDLGNEKLIFENLKCQNFQIYNRQQPFDKDHIKLILKQYGKFHGISFACKLVDPEKYEEITRDLDDLLPYMVVQPVFGDYVKYACKLALDSLDPHKDIKAIEKFKVYPDNVLETFNDKIQYRGTHSVILHGDCWSNNMMFKYDESNQLCDMRLLDFQLTRVGTPVFDLSYCLYSGGYEEIFNELYDYLRLYHDSLTETLGYFGLKSDDFYPFEVLKRDWKEYCLPGFFMGLLLWRNKLTFVEDIKDLTDLHDDGSDTSMFLETKYDTHIFQKRARDLILHMTENDFL